MGEADDDWRKPVDIEIMEFLSDLEVRLSPKSLAVNIGYSSNYVVQRCTTLRETGLLFKDEHATYAITPYGERVQSGSIPTAEISQTPPTRYTGETKQDRPDVVFAETIPLQHRVNFESMTIDEFTWGYRGEGPKRLAYALLGDVRDGQIAMDYAEEFHHDVTSTLDQEWELTRSEIDDWVDQHRE